MPDDAVELRATIATQQRALDVAHAKIREQWAQLERCNREMTKAMRRAEHAEERAAEIRAQWDRMRAQRDAQQRSNGATARARRSDVST